MVRGKSVPARARLACPASDDALLALLDEGVTESGDDGLEAARSASSASSTRRRSRVAATVNGHARRDLVDARPDRGDERLAGRVRQDASGVDDALLDTAGVDDEHDHQVRRAHRDELDVTHRRPGQ